MGGYLAGVDIVVGYEQRSSTLTEDRETSKTLLGAMENAIGVSYLTQWPRHVRAGKLN